MNAAELDKRFLAYLALEYPDRKLSIATLYRKRKALAEGDLAPVSCLQRNAAPCRQAAECRTLPVWRGYYDMTRQYFSGITLADLMNAPQGDNYVI